MRNFGFLNSSFVLLCLFYFNSLIGFANESTVLADSSKKEEKGIDIIVVGGLGIAYGSNFNILIKTKGWNDYFNIATTLGLGLEIPFTKSHIFSFELYSHSWLAKPSKKDNIIDKHFVKINDNLYAQVGLSGVVKVYTSAAPSKFRMCFHFGFMGISPKEEYYALDAGIGLNLILSKALNLQLQNRTLFALPTIEYKDLYVPNLLMLNICYKFNLEI